MSSPCPPSGESPASPRSLASVHVAAPSAPAVRQSTWRIDDVSTLPGPGPAAELASQEAVDALRASILHSLCSEYDARHLSAFLRGTGLRLGDAFWAMERAWAVDEDKHYRALRWLYARLFSVEESSLDAQLADRQPDFSALAPLLPDEFSLCVVLAFDELASARSYARDRSRPGLGSVGARLLNHIAQDEFLHCRNALDILRCCHRQRLPDVPDVLARVIAHDASPQFRYRATFLLDQILGPGVHDIDIKFLNTCAGRIVKYVNRCGQ